MTVWRPLPSLSPQDQKRALDLARVDAVMLRARRVHSREYEAGALAAREADLAAEHRCRAERASADPNYVPPISSPTIRGSKPWLAAVPMRSTTEDDVALPAGTLLLLDGDAWLTGRYSHGNPPVGAALPGGCNRLT